MIDRYQLHLFLLGAGMLLAGSSSAASDDADFAAVALTTVPRIHVLDGIVEAVTGSTVSAQTSGRVEAVQVDVDDFVEKGTVLLRIDPARQRSALEQARANLDEARARREEADTEFGRVRDLEQKRLASASELDRARAAARAAVARFEAAKAALSSATEEFERTVVRAPYTGVVTARHVEIGETVAPGTPLLSGLSTEQLRVVVRVPQSRIEEVRNASAASVWIDPAQVVDALRWLVFPVADAASNSFKVRVDLPAGRHGLAPGVFAKVGFELGQETWLTVPARAVARRGELTVVYVRTDSGQFRLRQVNAGRRHDDLIEIRAGLEVHERVALDPVRAGILMHQQSRTR